MKYTTVPTYINVCLIDRITSCCMTEYIMPEYIMHVFYWAKILRHVVHQKCYTHKDIIIQSS